MLLPVKLLVSVTDAWRLDHLELVLTNLGKPQSVLSWGCFGCWLIDRDLAKCWYDNIPSVSTKSRAPDLPTASEC